MEVGPFSVTSLKAELNSGKCNKTCKDEGVGSRTSRFHTKFVRCNEAVIAKRYGIPFYFVCRDENADRLHV